MITLYHAPMSRSSRVLWLLEELGTDYRIEPVAICRADGSGRTDKRNPHPLKKVPCIEVDGVLVVESLAIWIYLTDCFPAAKMAPKVGAVDRTKYMGLLGLATAVFEPLVTAVMENRPFTEREASARDALDRILVVNLMKHHYLLGSDFSTADLVYYSLLRYFPEALPSHSAYASWMDRIGVRPALARMREKDGKLPA